MLSASPAACPAIVDNMYVARHDWLSSVSAEQGINAQGAPACTCFRILDRDGDSFFTGPVAPGLYGIQIERGRTGIAARLADYARYKARHHRRVILSGPVDTDWVGFAAGALRTTPAEHLPRPSNPKVLVHSTTRASWPAIAESGDLRSLARLRSKGVALPGVGLRDLGEPADYADYVMLRLCDSIASELVVASEQTGRLTIDASAPYRPGVRIYLDAQRIIVDALGVRDGVHAKVRDHLLLADYMIDHISVENVTRDGNSPWTPRAFLAAANTAFVMRSTIEDKRPRQHIQLKKRS